MISSSADKAPVFQRPGPDIWLPVFSPSAAPHFLRSQSWLPPDWNFSCQTMRNSPTYLNVFTRPPTRLSCSFPATSASTSSNRSPYRVCTQHRSFLKPSSLGDLISQTTPLRQLTHTRVIPYPRSSLFDAISSVDKYPSFLPFVISAHVSETDQRQRPIRASLKVGYTALGIEEDWASIVNADEEHGIIEADSADSAQGNGEGLFEVLKTKWQLHDIEDIRRQGVGVGAQTSVRLDVEVKFRSPIYDRLFAGVEKEVAGMMVGAFEKRIKELAGS